MPNSHRASIISKPLFIIVAESMVMRFPIRQFGCANACSVVTFASTASGVFRNGPPEAVSTSRRTSPCARSEERRVGKECRSRWLHDHEKKENKDEQAVGHD